MKIIIELLTTLLILILGYVGACQYLKYGDLKKIDKDYNWLLIEVEKFGFKPEEALLVTYDGKGQIFCQKKENKKGN